MSYRNKIYISIGLFLTVSGILFGYVFGLFDQSNARLAESILERKKTFVELEAEQKSFEQGKQALNELLSKPYQPENFFTNDINLVHEIKIIESISEELQAQVSLGVSGVVKSANRAKTVSDIYIIPFIMQVQGGFPNVVKFMEQLEHESFPVTATTLSIAGVGKGVVHASLTGSLYVKK